VTHRRRATLEPAMKEEHLAENAGRQRVIIGGRPRWWALPKTSTAGDARKGNASGGQIMLEKRKGGCHCGRVRFQARVDLDLLSQCNCSICTKKGILHLPVAPEDFELIRGKKALTVYTFATGVAQHTFCSHCGMHAFYIPRSQPDRITVNARC
jgi:hypothetical protein